MNFDMKIDCCGMYCLKWDMMELLFGVFLDDGIVMWVVDMDFLVVFVIQDVVQV